MAKAPARAIKSRIDEIKVEMEKSTSDYDKEKLQERLAKLSGGVAVIRVGAATETELKEKKHRVEDALSAARAAVEEGIVPGGEISLITAAVALDKLEAADEDARVGINIVRRALEAPLRRLAENAGQDGAVIIDGIRRRAKDQKNKNIGYNVLSGEYVDMIDAGIIDPVKVVRGALENAASIAAMILTTDALVTDLPESSKMPAMPPGGGGMGGMGDFNVSATEDRAPGNTHLANAARDRPGVCRQPASVRGALQPERQSGAGLRRQPIQRGCHRDSRHPGPRQQRT